MKLFQAAFILAGVLALAGLYLVYPVQPVSGQTTATLPAGNYYSRISFNIYYGGRITGTFSDTVGNNIAVFVFDSSQFQTFRSTGTAGSMFSDSASSGSFSAAIASPGTYYIVLEHAHNTFGDAQTVQVTYMIDGKNLLMLGVGVSMIAAGILLGVFGRSLKRKSVAPRKHTDIIMFGPSSA